MEHPPGEEAQVDFFQGPPTFDEAQGRWRRPWIFRMTLSCSKHGYEEPLWTQERDGFLRAHEHAFVRLAGVPKVIRHDNLKAAVVRACLYDPDVSEVYAAFARHWGFVPLPSRPRHPQENGVAERSGGYVKSNALKGRRFDSLEALAAYLERWNRTVAQVRIHGTTRQQVLRHFLEVEQPALQPLPSEPFGLFQVGTRTVHPDGHVEVEGAFYSVPHTLVGELVRAQWDGHLVRIYPMGTDGERRAVAVHLAVKPGTYSTKPEHRPLHRPARQQAYEAILLSKIEHIGPQALAWAQAVDRRPRRARLSPAARADQPDAQPPAGTRGVGVWLHPRLPPVPLPHPAPLARAGRRSGAGAHSCCSEHAVIRDLARLCRARLSSGRGRKRDHP